MQFPIHIIVEEHSDSIRIVMFSFLPLDFIYKNLKCSYIVIMEQDFWSPHDIVDYCTVSNCICSDLPGCNNWLKIGSDHNPTFVYWYWSEFYLCF